MPRIITKQSIREYRKSLKLSQEEFAELMSVSVHAVRTWEQPSKVKFSVPKHLLTNPRTKHLAVETEEN